MDAATLFAEIYRTDAWNGGSGPGSDPRFCEPLVDWLSNWIRDHQIRSIVDLGCGDCRWMPQVVERTGISYRGIDVVLDVVVANKSRLSPGLVFAWDDFTTDPSVLPVADLYWAKDVLQHWDDRTIESWLDRFFAARPGAQLLVANCSNQRSSPRSLDPRWHFAPLSGSLEPLSLYDPDPVFQWATKTIYRLHSRSSTGHPRTSESPAACPQSHSRGA